MNNLVGYDVDDDELSLSVEEMPEEDTEAQDDLQIAGVSSAPPVDTSPLPGGSDLQRTPERSGVAASPESAAPSAAAAADVDEPLLPPELREPPPLPDSPSALAAYAASEQKVAKLIELQRARQRTITSELRNKREYKNPAFLAKCVEYHALDEYASAFQPHVYDPKNLPPEDFLDALKKQQQKQERERERARAASGRVGFEPGGVQRPPLQVGGLKVGEAVVRAQAEAVAKLSKFSEPQSRPAPTTAVAGAGAPRRSKWDNSRHA